jgi:hypothetical protein
MSTKERASLGFGDELDAFDPAAFAPKPASKPRPAAEVTKRAGEAAGFHSREAAKPEEPAMPAPVAAPSPTPARPDRRRRTGRNVQFNIKTKQETIEAFLAVADANGWGIGETFEKATELLQRQHGKKA